MRKPTFQEMAHAGFHFHGARAWIDGNVPALAQDAALVTTPNTTVPVEFTAYIDPLVAIFVSWLIFSQPLDILGWIGAALIAIATIYADRHNEVPS